MFAITSIYYFSHKVASNKSESDVVVLDQQQRHHGNNMLFTSRLDGISSEQY